MADVEEACYTGLHLGLGVEGSYYHNNNDKKPKIRDGVNHDSNFKRRHKFYAASRGLSLIVSSEEEEDEEEEEEEEEGDNHMTVHPGMAAGRDIAPGPGTPRICNSDSIATSSRDGNNHDGCRKKLRLSEDQSALLEGSFKIHKTLTPAQKQSLADKLNLEPRQVEVWFQNRRARSKLKQIELDFERLKKKCDNLIVKNQRLEKELHDLRSMKDERSLHVHLPDSNPAAFLLCSSCQKLPVMPLEETKAAAVLHYTGSKENCRLRSGDVHDQIVRFSH